ncbi:MAG TPA: ArsR family transcriptional regulator [Gammaproteobacteria bacterium]|jgi:DNA-binding transcriptional ArsR family regulator|nr:ArsR family transcriptional regulator [Gammaproteobacteria bacterium]
MNDEKMIQILSELGNKTRIDIYRLLISYGDEGLVVGEIGKRLDIPPSTLNFHLRGLVDAGLVSQVKQGRSIICTAKLEQLTEVLSKLQSECCSGIG